MKFALIIKALLSVIIFDGVSTMNDLRIIKKTVLYLV